MLVSLEMTTAVIARAGIREVCISVPTVVGRGGCVARHQIDLWPKEVQALRKSGLVLRQTLETVLGRIGRTKR